MSPFETVIVPHDGSTLADTAVPYAIELAAVSKARVVLLRVLEELRPIYDVGSRELVWIDPEKPRAEMTAPEILEPVRERVASAGLEATSVVRIGDPRREIVAEAEQHPTPVIVIASHGRGGLERVVLGSVAARVLQTSSCPVLLVRARAARHQAADVAFKRITVPIDGSELSERALPPAVAIAKASGARLHLVRVAETYRDELPPEPAHFLASPSFEAMLEQFDRLEREATDYLRAVADRLGQESIAVSWEVLSGDPWRQLEQYAERDAPDLIVMTTHGRGGLARWFYGSVADRLLTSCDVPMLVIRANEAKERS